jgi:DNA-binding CsgD family transcriptional regulator
MEDISSNQQDTVLTDGERQVLALVTRGHTNKEIADELFLAINSVKSYMHSIFSKLKVKNRAQAVIMALTSGYLNLHDVFTLDEIADMLASLELKDFETISVLVEQKRQQY